MTKTQEHLSDQWRGEDPAVAKKRRRYNAVPYKREPDTDAYSPVVLVQQIKRVKRALKHYGHDELPRHIHEIFMKFAQK